jgi:hypothetical protein
MLAGRYCGMTTRMEESVSKLTDIETATNEFNAELHSSAKDATKVFDLLSPNDRQAWRLHQL